ncbi:molybdenum cofactor biosynthesis enzyme [Sphaerochaeta pleomorpha str. Grapes]|uniref:Molybdenum cofactor biosynthesis enzyme n=1 Tax=Sphaerochaeta pleomorpha (strain ATCC BAA-1885 / DSM 22778 / Grapes) TaxID=158190 RepID=G8QTB9_SPHPG|nr:radical SAM protein [Sphaerochaeta pleomorpha]AEV29086.1 molybdenum cofactor biosynthesis enzyme [Sphaerochaeta pleomorpha str. Grapes]
MISDNPSRSDPLVDAQGRVLTYLRVSVTDACNYRCLYCGPQQTHGIFDDSQIMQLCRIFKNLGIDTIRITGGEPLVRKDLPSLVASIASLGFSRIGMTTNGSLLSENALPLAHAGLNGVNISLDATEPSLFASLSGGYSVEPVLLGIEKALEAGLQVKLNCVPLLDTYQKQIPQVMELARSLGVPVRFIELMPIGNGCLCQGVPFTLVRSFLRSNYGNPEPLEAAGVGGSGPARYSYYGNVAVGTIEALSACFCSACNRLRLTSNGLLRSCLYHDDSLELLPLLKANATDAQIELAIRQFVTKKPLHHDFALQGMSSCSLASFGG